MKASIERVGGVPTVVIDGKPYPLTQSVTVRTHEIDGIKFDKEYFTGLGKAGIKLFYVTCDTVWGVENSVDLFKQECEMLLECVPDAYIMVRIGLHPPTSFTDEHPEECFTYDDGSSPSVHIGNETFSRTYSHLYSEASSVWRERSGRALMETCDLFDQMPFADRIVGFFFAAGGTSEWYYLLDLTSGERYGDFSLAFKREFSAYLKEKYETDEALRKAWKDENATIENPTIPTLKERFYEREFDQKYWREDEASVSNLTTVWENGANIGSFLNVDEYQNVADFYDAWHYATAKSQVYFAKLVKERYQGNKLTGSFYGSYGCTDFFNGSTCTGVLHILDSEYMDFLASPGVYVNRQPGGFTGQREMADSFAIRNRLFIVEEDSRTHLEHPHFQAMFDYYDIEDTYNVLKRDFGRNLCENLPSWWYDHFVGGGRYKHEQIYSLFARQTEIIQDALTLPDRRKGNEIAFIYDEESVHTISNQSTKELVEYFRNYEIARIGAGVDQYYHNDLSNPNMP
ncbi:MAG: hypothetical protein IIX01_04940, partial [Clostridia bacterium]|nr:hypothetical protein [Clostridia bacterium]